MAGKVTRKKAARKPVRMWLTKSLDHDGQQVAYFNADECAVEEDWLSQGRYSLEKCKRRIIPGTFTPDPPRRAKRKA